MPDILEDILQLRGIPKESPIVMQDGVRSVAFLEKKLVYLVIEQDSAIQIHAQAELKQKPNYRLVNTLNNNTLLGKYTIVDQSLYNFDITQGKDVLSDKLEEFVEHTFHQAQIGYDILNTTSQKKREKLLAEKKAEMKAEKAKL